MKKPGRKNATVGAGKERWVKSVKSEQKMFEMEGGDLLRS